MTIHPRPEQEAQIQEAMRAGLIRSAEEVIDAGLEHLRERARSGEPPSDAKNLIELFEPVRGILTDEEVDTLFQRDPSPGRLVDLS
jgi:hypothetical protein